MGVFSSCGEFAGSAVVAFIRTKAKLKKKELIDTSDYCPEEAKQFISESLEHCRPASEDLTWLGRKITKYNLDRNDYFGSLLGIDANTKSTKRTICILALKTAAKCICSGYSEEAIRAVTYSYLALR